jgi:hypothetical protein
MSGELPGYDNWKTTPPPESDETRADDMERERRWWEFELECRDFASREPDGFAAVLRAVARAMKEQRTLAGIEP